MINPFKTKNAIITRNDCLYKIKATFFGDIEVTRVDFHNQAIVGDKNTNTIMDEAVWLHDFSNKSKKRKNGISK